MKEFLIKIWMAGNRWRYGNNEVPDSEYFGILIGILVFVVVLFISMIFIL